LALLPQKLEGVFFYFLFFLLFFFKKIFLKNFLFIFPFKKLIYKHFSAFSAKAKMASAERKDFWLIFYATAHDQTLNPSTALLQISLQNWIVFCFA
jgi:hypothetical protein